MCEQEEMLTAATEAAKMAAEKAIDFILREKLSH